MELLSGDTLVRVGVPPELFRFHFTDDVGLASFAVDFGETVVGPDRYQESTFPVGAKEGWKTVRAYTSTRAQEKDFTFTVYDVDGAGTTIDHHLRVWDGPPEVNITYEEGTTNQYFSADSVQVLREYMLVYEYNDFEGWALENAIRISWGDDSKLSFEDLADPGSSNTYGKRYAYHTYDVAGVYEIEVTATDQEDQTATATHTLTVY